MKILITGNSGSGKSTYGKKLSSLLGIPLYGLDKVVWDSKWTPVSKEERIKRITKIVERDCWIIEGVSKLAIEKADKVIFLDIPHYKCIYNIVRRFIGNGLKTRSELPDNCPEYIGVVKALRISFVFIKSTRPWIMSYSDNKQFIRITSHNDLDKISIQ